MKKTEENRYPHSATLFRFCKEALALRYEGNVKVIDQDVGAILGYDPADCSHWKKGKKNIRALSTLRSIAEHLNIDERLLIDITSGKVSLEEAVFEYKGYGTFALRGKSLENLKKEYFKNPNRWNEADAPLKNFEELFKVDRPAIAIAVENIIQKGKFFETPIYVPEVYGLFEGINLVMDPNAEDALITENMPPLPSNTTDSRSNGRKRKPLETTVMYRGPEMRPFMRFLATKELFQYLCRTRNPILGTLVESPIELIDVQANIFAGMLLVPDSLLKKEVDQLDCALDLVAQLADTFWVSKSLLNQRLRDYVENFNRS